MAKIRNVFEERKKRVSKIRRDAATRKNEKLNTVNIRKWVEPVLKKKQPPPPKIELMSPLAK